MDYYSASSDRQKTYDLEPLALLNHSGWEYLLANDAGADGKEKLFRLDRVGLVRKSALRFSPPKDMDLERFRTPELYKDPADCKTEVHFKPPVQNEAEELFGAECGEHITDGWRAGLDLSSPVWLARFILPFGTDAEVTGPDSQREVLRALCAEAAELYAQD
jgi:predicted DNA-binding transcriptional regulator YafY